MLKPVVVALIQIPFLIFSLESKAAYLSEAQQLSMYRECRATYSDKDLYFAKKMCGCLVQAYIHDLRATQSAPKCMKYATTNPY